MPTVAEVQARLEAINLDLIKTKEQMLRLDGAAQDCRYWLAVVTQEEEARNAVPPEPLEEKVIRR